MLKIYFLTLKKEKVQNWACNPNFNPDRASEYYEGLIDINQNSVLEKKNSFVSAQTNWNNSEQNHSTFFVKLKDLSGFKGYKKF